MFERSAWLIGFDEKTGRVRDEGAVPLDVLVEREESAPVPIDSEVRDDPNDQTEEVDDRSDIVEDRAQSFSAEVLDLQTDGFGGFLGKPWLAGRPRRLGAHHELSQLSEGMGPDLLREEGSRRAKDPSHLLPPRLDRMTACD